MNNGLFDGQRSTINDNIERTVESLNHYLSRYDDVCFAWSGGKDSTTALTVTLALMESGRVPMPKSITVLYADTRQEILPLAFVAQSLLACLAERGIAYRVVTAPLDRRMWCYILGRGVPPPNNNTLRYCTRQIKVEPMAEVVSEIARERGKKVLTITGVRQGESAVRDGRIALSCSRDGGECGQGWFQETLPEAACDTLAPILHWRVCHVWAWLRHWAPDYRHGEWPTTTLADAYGGDEAEEINARTGCVCCPLAARDSALDAVIAMPHWSYLAPLKRIRTEIYEWLRFPAQRLRKPGGESRKDGSLSKNQNRMGPIHLDARREGLRRLLEIQAEVNAGADALGLPRVDHLNAEEEARIHELIDSETWPNGWDGTEPRANEPFEEWCADGSRQPLLFS